MRGAELREYKQLHPPPKSKVESDSGDEDESDDEGEERGRSRTRSSRESGSDSEEDDESTESGSESDVSSSESGNERGSESGLNEKARMKKKESPKKSNLRRSNRASKMPKRYNPLTEQGSHANPAARPRMPNFPRMWSGGDSRGSSRSHYYSRLGYDTDTSDSEDLPRNLPSLRMGASIPQPLNLPRSVAAGKGTSSSSLCCCCLLPYFSGYCAYQC